MAQIQNTQSGHQANFLIIHLNSNNRCCHVKTLLHEFNSTVVLAYGFMKEKRQIKRDEGIKEPWRAWHQAP